MIFSLPLSFPDNKVVMKRIKEEVEKLSENRSDLNEQYDDSDIVWGVNYDQFHLDKR